MDFEIQRHKGCCIFNLNCSELSKEHIEAINCHVEKFPKVAKFALNFKKIKRVHESFFEFIKDKSRGGNFSLFGLDSKVLAYFSLRKSINLAPIFLDVNDFIKDKRRIIKRDFRIVMR